MTKKQYVTLSDPKMYLHTQFYSFIYRYVPGLAYIELKPVVKGHSVPEMIVDSSRPKNVFTSSFIIHYQIFD